MASRDGTILQSGAGDTFFTSQYAHKGCVYLPWVDLICAGVPCQDVSIAGKRAGLAGERTGLFYEFARILQELRPTWFVFENVPGLLSSNQGRDFAEILRVLMVECGYGVCWRVLDSQFFGVAQRRRRVFIVGHFGKPCPAEVLFESTGGGRNFAPGQETGTGIAYALAAGAGGSKFGSGRHNQDTFVTAPIVSNGDAHSGFRDDHGIVTAVRTAFTGANGIGILDDGSTHTLDGTGSAQAICFESRFARNGRGAPSGIVPPLKAESGQTGKGDGAPMVAFAQNNDSAVESSVAATITRDGVSGSKGGHGAETILYVPDVAATIGSNASGGQRTTDFETTGAFIAGTLGAGRRGTDVDAAAGNQYVSAPTDANRMRDFAGLPEGLDSAGLPLPVGLDSARYRALGNAVTVQVARWIAARIRQYELTTKDTKDTK